MGGDSRRREGRSPPSSGLLRIGQKMAERPETNAPGCPRIDARGQRRVWTPADYAGQSQ